MEGRKTTEATGNTESAAEAHLQEAEGAHELFRLFPSDGVTRPGFCTECQDLSLSHFMGPRIEGSYRGCLVSKTVEEIEKSAAHCQLCHCIAFAIKLSSIEPEKSHHVWLRPVEQPSSGTWLSDLSQLFGFQIINGDSEHIEKLLSGPGVFHNVATLIDDRRESVEDRILGFLRYEGPKYEVGDAVDETINARMIQMTVQLVTGPKRPPKRDLKSLKVPETLRGWVRGCEDQHGLTCGPVSSDTTLKQGQRYGPKRLLQVQSCNGRLNVRLHQMEKNMPPYVALSHCWGSTPIVRTTVSSLRLFLQDIPFSTLPKTFQDAIEITIQLGLSWLWIDSLCIIQDDPPDWAAEAPNMKSVYSGAYLTIAASASASAAGGCFPHMPGLSDCVGLAHVDESLWPGAQQIVLAPYPGEVCTWSLEDEPLQQRAWSLQERLLSRRIVHCSRFEYIWLCRGEPEFGLSHTPRARNYCQSFLGTDVGRHDSWDLNLEGIFATYPDAAKLFETNRHWVQCAADFSHRSLTFPSDKTFAIQGLADFFRNESSGRYAYGMWESMFPGALAWKYTPKPSTGYADHAHVRVYYRNFDFSPADKEGQRYFPDRAPSWSWLRVDGRVDLEYRLGYAAEPSSEQCAKLLYNSQHEPKVQFGWDTEGYDVLSREAISSAALTVTGSLLDIKLARGLPYLRPGEAEAKAFSLYNLKDWHWRLLDDTNIMNAESRVRMDDPSFPISETASTQYSALIMNKVSWVLLAQTEPGSHYRRVGVLTRILEDAAIEMLDPGDEDYEVEKKAGSEWRFHLEQVVSRASERSILIY